MAKPSILPDREAVAWILASIVLFAAGCALRGLLFHVTGIDTP